MDFERDEIKQFGMRGDPQFEKTEESTDLEEMKTREKTTYGFCYCGRPAERGDVMRCVSCDLISCKECSVTVRNRVLCHSCAEQGYELDKDMFLTLFLISRDFASIEELVSYTVESEGELVEVRIDESVHPMVQNGYVNDAGEVTTLGQEVLDVGSQLYGDSRAVQKVFRNVEVQEAASRR